MCAKTLCCTLFFVAASGASAFAQTTWYVDVNAVPPGLGTQASPYSAIQYAHDQATTVDFDTISVAPGTYVGNFSFSKRITIRAQGGAEVTTLRPASAGPILTLAAPADELDVLVVEGFTITGSFGTGFFGAVLSYEGTLQRCIVRDNPSCGVVTGYDTVLVDCTITGNAFGIEGSTLSDAIWMNSCIVWGNGVNHIFGPQPIGSDIRYCAGGPFHYASGPGNVIGDPGLWNVASGDLHLLPGSPCIDAGDPALPNDPDGTRDDIGCLVYDPLYTPPSLAFCSGDGALVDHTTNCPCGNIGATGNGCAHSFSALGANLAATGTPALDDIVLASSNTPVASFVLFLQHDAAGDHVFHDGVLCASGSLTRLRGRTAVAGAASFPNSAFANDATTTLSQRGGVSVGSGVRRYYSAFFRNASTTFCPPATANVTNGWTIVW